MPDLNKVKRNIQKMITGGASSQEIDEYARLEGVTPQMIKGIRPTPQLPPSYVSGLQQRVPRGQARIQKPPTFLQRAIPAAGQIAGGLGGFAAGALTGHPTAAYAGGAAGGTLGRGLGYLATRPVQPAQRFPEKVAGILNPAYRLFQAFQQMPQEEKQRFGRMMGTTAGTEVVGAGLGALGTKAVRRLPGITRAIGGVYRETKTLAQKIGMPRIAKMVGKGVKAFNEDLVPRVQQSVQKFVMDFTDDAAKFFNKLGMSDDAIKTFKKSGLSNVRKSQSRWGNNTASLSNKLQTTLGKNLDDAGKGFDDFLLKQPQDTFISAKGTLKEMEKVFKKEGYMFSDGTFRDVDWNLAPRQMKLLRDVYADINKATRLPKEFLEDIGESVTTTRAFGVKFFETTGKPKMAGKIPLSDYFRYKGILDNAVSGTPYDRVIFQAKSGLVDDAVRQIKGLDKVNLKYAQAKQLFDKFTPESKTGERVLAKYIKLTAKQKAELGELNKVIPFIDDLQRVNAGQELDDIMVKRLSPRAIESDLNSFSGFRTPAGIGKMKEVEELYNLLPDKEITKDSLAFFLGQDLYQETINPVSLLFGGGILRKGGEALTRFGIHHPGVVKGLSLPMQPYIRKPIGRGIVTGVTEQQIDMNRR